MRRVEFHGIAGLLAHNSLDSLPQSLRVDIRRIAVSQAFWEAEHVRRLRPLLEGLEQIGAGPLLFKGTALAYTVYDEPSTRRRGDTDILVRESSFEEACHVNRSFGFTPINSFSVRALGAQTFTLTDEHGQTHALDLHQRINSSPIIARLFPHNELWDRSKRISKIGVGARALGLSDAMLVACFHRLIHSQSPYYVDGRSYLSSDRLIWLYDINLLLEKLSGSGEKQLLELARAKGHSAILLDGLRAADHWLGLSRNGLISRLGPGKSLELPYRYLKSGAAKRRVLDLVATRRKGQFLLDLFAPPREYMTGKYREHGPATLTLFYVWRAFHGLYKAARRRL